MVDAQGKVTVVKVILLMFSTVTPASCSGIVMSFISNKR